MGTIHVKLYGIWTSGSEGDSVKRHSYLELWQPLCSADRNHRAILIEGIMRNNYVKSF